MFPPIPDVLVHNWRELVDALHDPSMLRRSATSGGHARSDFVFRGMSDAAWPLATSLDRLGTPAAAVERPLLRNFRKYAPPGLLPADSEWELLAVAQHNGLPTRCLDWTFSPLVAAHFATAERAHLAHDGVIWCFDVVAWRDHLLAKPLLSRLHAARAWLYDVRLLESGFADLEALDRCFVEEPGLVFFEPPSIDARIANQGGILSLMGGASLDHHAYMFAAAARVPGIVRRIVIEAPAKSEIRDMLDQDGITERVMFPGLPGLADWLRRYYGPS